MVTETTISWNARTVAVSELKPYEKNPRKIAPKDYERLLASLRQDGYHQRILTTQDLRVIGGHQRIKALKELGIESIEVLVPDNEISDEQFKRILVRDNVEYGEWVIEGLGDMMEVGDLIDLGIDEGLFPAEKMTGKTGDDEAPPAPETPTSVEGDVWLMGEHRLMCGSSTSAGDVAKLMSGGKAEMVFTDPPYRMNAEGGSNQPIGRAAAKLGETIKHLCDFNPVEFLEQLPRAFYSGVMNAYIFCNKDLLPDYLNWALSKGYNFNLLFWKKPNAIPLGGQHRPDVEYIILVRKGAVWNNAMKDVNYSKCLEYGRENSTIHPTMKPVELIVNELRISSNHGSIVLDCFGGSGSTLIACEKTGRVARLMELDPKYADVIVQRWQDYTGKEATHEATGETFAKRKPAE